MSTDMTTLPQLPVKPQSYWYVLSYDLRRELSAKDWKILHAALKSATAKEAAASDTLAAAQKLKDECQAKIDTAKAMAQTLA